MPATPSATITREDLEDLPSLPSQVPRITDVKHLSSYSWIESKKPTIAVPGSPALWTTPKVPRRLKKDTGFFYTDQNAARHPDSPIEPLFRALHVTDPSFDFRPVDIVTDRNNIRKLLSFVNPTTNRSGLEPFTINIETNHRTAIFCRQAAKTHGVIGPDEFKGFGHEFEKTYTREQCRGSSGHHRIISYRFGGLTFVVRHVTEAYVASVASQAVAPKRSSPDDISSIMASLSLSPTASRHNTPGNSKITIRHEGKTVPIASTLELKTRVFHKPLEIRELAVQLWASQTPKLVRAYHRGGLFQEPKVEDVTRAIKTWERDHIADLAKLAALLTKILSIARELGGRVVMRYDKSGDKLKFTRAEGEKMLPDDLYSIWADKPVAAEATSAKASATTKVEDDSTRAPL